MQSCTFLVYILLPAQLLYADGSSGGDLRATKSGLQPANVTKSGLQAANPTKSSTQPTSGLPIANVTKSSLQQATTSGSQPAKDFNCSILGASASEPWKPRRSCLRKCCKIGEDFDWKNKTCKSTVNAERRAAEWKEEFSHLHVFQEWRCPGVAVVTHDQSTDGEEEYYLDENGFIKVTSLDLMLDFRNFCMDHLINVSGFHPVICAEDLVEQEGMKQAQERFRFLLKGIGMGASVLFLGVTLGLYVAAPKLREKVHDKCFMCHAATLIVGFCCLIIIQQLTLEGAVCVFFGYMTQFWMLAAFFWLNVMCIDMWRSIGVLENHNKSQVKKLALYCLYAWGSPFLILVGTLLADHILSTESPWKPGFDMGQSCWFQKRPGKWMDPGYIYFYSFVTITLLINVYTFVSTASLIMYQNKPWKGKHADSERHATQNTRFFLYLKLFLVMGLNWMMEVISYHSDGDTGGWLVIDIMNTLTGFYIFLIFICNKRVIMILKKRFYPKEVFRKEYNKQLAGSRGFDTKSTKTSYCSEDACNVTLKRINSVSARCNKSASST